MKRILRLIRDLQLRNKSNDFSSLPIDGTPIPTYVILAVSGYIEENYTHLKDKGKARLIHRIISLWSFISYKSSENNNHLTNIHSKKLGKFEIVIEGNRFYPLHLIRILLSLDLIYVNNAYSDGNYPKSYKVTNKSTDSDTSLVKIDSKFFDIKNKEEYIKNFPEHKKLINDIYSTKLDPYALKYIDSRIGYAYKTNTDGSPVILTKSHAYYLKLRALKVILGHHFFSVADADRVYSSISNLPKILLRFLRINGNKLVEIDLKNCQPLLLSIILNNAQFKSDCESGKFYDILAKELNCNRDKAKNLSFAKIFFNNKRIPDHLSKVLDSIWGASISDKINQFKLKKGSTRQELLWFILQSKEASIFIKTALESNVFCLTRHDSILVEESNVDLMLNKLIKAFDNFGVKPTFSVNSF